MGIFKGGLLILSGILLFVALLAGGSFLTLSMSLDYNVVQPELTRVVGDLFQENLEFRSGLLNSVSFMELHCQNNSDFVYSDGTSGYTFVLPCDVISQGADDIVEEGIAQLVEKIYYRDYDCNLFDCAKDFDAPFYLVSQHAKDYWKGKFYASLFAVIILLGLVYFFVEQKENFLIVAGSIFILASLPFLKIGSILSLFLGKFFQFVGIFFTKSHISFWILMILGVLILGAGIGLKIWIFGSGRNKKEFSKEEVKEIVKKEVKDKQ